MGEVHNELRRSNVSAAVSRALGDTRGGGVERYGETLTPVMDIWSRPEWSFLRDERLCGGTRNEPAGAATELSSIALVNFATNVGLLCIVQSVCVSIPVGALVRLNMSTEAGVAALVNDTGGANVDTRFANVTEPRCRLRAEAVAALVGVRIDELSCAALDRREIESGRNIVLSPGFALVVQNTDDAATLQVAFRWRERRAMPGELV